MKKEILKILIAASLISSIASIAFAQATTTLGELGPIINRIKTFLQALGAVLAIVFVILGGYRILMAGGAKEEVETGRRYILYAITGLALILVAEVLAKVACYIGTGNWTCPS